MDSASLLKKPGVRAAVILIDMLIIAAVLVGVVEVAARVFGPDLLPVDTSRDVAPGESLPGEPNLVGDALLGWRILPGKNRQFGVPVETEVSSRGLRSPELPLEPPEGTRRAIIVGDSTIYGVMVRDEETISGRLQARLSAIDPGIEVLNGGCPGYSSWQALHLLESRLMDYQPELVIVGALWSDTQGADRTDAERFGGERRGLLARSRAFMLAGQWYSRKRWSQGGDGAPNGPADGALQDGPQGGPGGGAGPNGPPLNGAGPNGPPLGGPDGGPEEVTFGLRPTIAPTNRVPLGQYTRNLYDIAELAERHGAQVAFVVLPSTDDLDGGRVKDFREGYREAMRATAADLGAPIADTPARFVGGKLRRLFNDEVHPRPPGHDMIAEALEEALRDWAAGP